MVGIKKSKDKKNANADSGALLLGRAIRLERKRSRLTQAELGELARTGLNFISQLERGKKTVRVDKVVSVLRILGLELRLVRGKNVVSVTSEILGER